MKALKSNVRRCIPVGAIIECVDNTGAKKLNLISVKGYHGRKRRLQSAKVGDIVVCSVRKGTQKWRKQVVKALIIRQKKEYKRTTGVRIKFEDNAAIIVNDKVEPQGSQIKGPVDKEVINRFLHIGKFANFVA
ncbi:MAG: 50S ribosomal protein L14 [Candidatus Aenigmarchaeota archaeon CG_4_10_14_0_8_um_filter_37_24]|nr:50S ribosomal protein L14 [Candidatus Aenigmarchaeota archaeon]OIN86573.1 MAG: 50S ribosomal protein L14 [Candidatus Aenigmarchaeota archaeon CG1_02_38_14]PIV69394.1 MAG: 50S ribosomal protein L14 [Candidatus Aenigmarchaeota archaeon CG01_land_8_20_14_3_00_37_9]PIW41708.1 MAG: 50S ribosomal protein L14 [Candidatus Aenigmarchaeota archaeon CG15_BIG_FIL_POST_REV_8_21_14_020_37_27]PIX50545.1 MAG: 50S ribosomal protein L14 [Candidatus Aenigmarchaeota archaeon CG_4_8_14_3_um_filter_37_24]PIY3490